MQRHTRFLSQLLVLVLLTVGAVGIAEEPTEQDLVRFATQQIPEFKDFYAILAQKVAGDSVLKKAGFSEKDVALAGGITREIAQHLRHGGGAKDLTFSEIHRSERDLDILI